MKSTRSLKDKYRISCGKIQQRAELDKVEESAYLGIRLTGKCKEVKEIEALRGEAKHGGGKKSKNKSK